MPLDPNEPHQPLVEDAQLYRALRAGDRRAMVSLYRRHAGLVYGLALAILKNEQEAEDLSQEVFTTLWRTNSYDPERGTLARFLVVLTRSRALDRLRGRGRKLQLFERFARFLPAQPAAPTPLDRASAQEYTQEVREALAQLPDSDRKILELSFFGGLSYSQISEKTGTPLGTVKRWARRGMNQLKAVLAHLAE